tara:strand:- start:536 stop:964 length:429 start_codon:yes stop_codon:yes gene_type:complete
MILCKFPIHVTPKCLEWLEYLFYENASGEVEMPLKTEFGLIRPDESLIRIEEFIAAMVEISDCGKAIRFTFYPPRQVEFGGEFAQKLFALIAPATIHLQSHIPPEFLKRHGTGRVWLKDFVEYPIHEFASRDEYKGVDVESN